MTTAPVGQGAQTSNPAAASATHAQRDTLILSAAFILFAGLLALAGGRHEPWFDEAQAWLIARDSNPWAITTHLARYEGTPALWHIVLWAAQRLGVSYSCFWLISAALACGGVWITLFKSPFPLGLRIGLIVSYFFCYQYAVVARSYALELLLIPWLAWLFVDRLSRPALYGAVLGLLANANAHGFVIAAPLALEVAWAGLRAGQVARPRFLAGAGIYLASAAAAVFQAWPPSDKTFNSLGGVYPAIARPIMILPEAFIDRLNALAPVERQPHLHLSGLVLTLLLLIPIGVLCVKARRGWIAGGLFGALFGFTFLLTAQYWHAGLFYLVVVFGLWISWSAVDQLRLDHRIWLTGALGLLMVYGAIYSACAWTRDIRYPYSGGREAAKALHSVLARQPRARIAAVGFKTFAVQPNFATNPFANFRPGPDHGSYYRWSTQSGVPLYPTPSNWNALLRSHSYDWLLLSNDTRDIPFDRPAYQSAAQAQGYCVKGVFLGSMIWKTRLIEPDSLMLFGRC